MVAAVAAAASVAVVVAAVGVIAAIVATAAIAAAAAAADGDGIGGEHVSPPPHSPLGPRPEHARGDASRSLNGVG